MSQIADLGVNFKMTGANDFESRLKSLESHWKGFAGAMDKAPAFNHHFDKMGAAAEHAGKRISSAMAATKAAVAGVLAAKAGSGLFNWAIGSDEVSKRKVFAESHMDNLGMYEQYFSEIRDKHNVTKADLISGAYEIESALSGKPEAVKIEAFKTMSYYMTELGLSFEQSAQFYKKLMASFGSFQPLEKQMTAAKDYLGLLNATARASSANPIDIQKGVQTVGSSYGKRGWTAEDLFAHLAYLTPTMKSPDEAANALLRITEKSPEYAQKLAAAQYRMDFMAGRVQGGVGGKQFKDYDEMVTASKESAFPNRQKAAQHALAELKIGEEHYGKEAEKEVERYIQQRKPTEIFDMLNKQVQDIQKRSANPETTLKDVFSEYSGPAVSFLRGFALGEIERLKQTLQKSSGQSVVDQVDTAKSKQLPENWGIVQQKAEDFSTSLRGIFYEPMKALLEEWKNVFQQLEKSFTGTEGMKKIQGFGGNLVTGYREGRNQGLPVAEDNRSVGQMFQEYIAALNPEDFRSAGKQIGKAATDFMTAASQLKEMIGAAHKYFRMLSPEEPTGSQKKPSGTPILGGLWDFDFNKSFPGWLLRGAPATEQPALDKLQPQGVAPDLMIPAHGRSSMVVPPDNLQSAHAPTGETGSPITIIQKHENIVQLDGREIAREVAPEVKEIIDADKDRNRSNANDKPLMGND